MLEDLMRECKNWFVIPNGVHLGNFTIDKGSISLPFLSIGQYFRIVGSTFNDGVHEYGNADLSDESFDGAVWELAVPDAFVSLSEKIESWRTKYENAAASPFQSESFAGYTYSLKDTAEGSWQKTFSKELTKWRKL